MKAHTKLALGTALAALLSSVSTASLADDITVAGVLINTQDPFWTTIGCGAQARANELGVTLELYSAPNMDAAQMTAAFDAALLSSPDGLFGTSTAPNQFVTQFGELMANGVPVVTGNPTDPAAQYRVVWSSGDTAPYIDQLLPLIPEAEGTMLVLGGVQGLPPLEVRYVPLVDAVLAARPGLHEIERIYSFFNINAATSGVEAALIANPDLKVIVASNGPDGIGAAAAVRAAGLQGQVTVIAFDAVPPEIEALREGTITALIAQSPAQIGAVSVQSIVDYLRSGATGAVAPSDEFIGIPQRMLTAENVDDPANADYIYHPLCD